jgi:tetratricopeptide (TPR) repeat protein
LFNISLQFSAAKGKINAFDASKLNSSCQSLSLRLGLLFRFWYSDSIMIKNFLFLVGIVCVFAGCSTRQMAVQWSLPLVADQVLALQEESDLELAREAIPGNLKILEGLLKGDPSNPELLKYLAEGFCSYAYTFVKEEDPERARELYLRGRNYALQALPVFELEKLSPTEIKVAISSMTRDELPALFWTGQCWGEWLTLSLSEPRAFADISKLEVILHRNLELDEAYHFAGSHLALGVFYGSRSRMLGGNPEKAKFHFERSLELTENKYLLAYYFYAKTYAVQMQDRDLFEKLLNTIQDSPREILPAQRLANETARKQAGILLKMADELF